MDIFNISRNFPKEERYPLTDQVIRFSRSISADIAEEGGKRIYENEFKKHLVYAMGSWEETKMWLRFGRDCQYIREQDFEGFSRKCDELGVWVYNMRIGRHYK